MVGTWWSSWSSLSFSWSSLSPSCIWGLSLTYLHSILWNFISSNYIQLWVLQTTQQRCFAYASAIDTPVALSIATPRTRARAFCFLILAPDFRTGCGADRRTKKCSRAITSICGFAELSSIETILPSWSSNDPNLFQRTQSSWRYPLSTPSEEEIGGVHPLQNGCFRWMIPSFCMKK